MANITRIARRNYIAQSACNHYLRCGFPSNVYIGVNGVLLRLIGYDYSRDELLLGASI